MSKRETSTMRHQKCRANCYLLEGDKENARKLWQQIKDLNADYMRNQPDSNPLKKMFGD